MRYPSIALPGEPPHSNYVRRQCQWKTAPAPSRRL